jgi:hypothetical protein
MASELTKDEHKAAPLNPETGKREYGKLIAGRATRLFLDLWRIAINHFETGNPRWLDGALAGLKGFDSPQCSLQPCPHRK